MTTKRNFGDPNWRLQNYLDNCERTVIEAALRKRQWSVTKAAKLLGVKRTTLCAKMTRLNIKRKYRM